MSQLDALSWVYMTGVVNNIKTPNRFLSRLLTTREETLPIETVTIETESAGRDMAPFVQKNGEAIMVGGYGGGSYTVTAPNIRIKKPLNVSNALFQRRPGQNLMQPTSGVIMSNVEVQVARDLENMENRVVNTEEYMWAMCLRGQIVYQEESGAIFRITYARPSANNITLSIFWNAADPTTLDILGNLFVVKQVISEDGSPPITDAICGSEAGVRLQLLASSGALKFFNTNASNAISVGTLTFVENFSDDGAIFLGEMSGIRFWMYPRTSVLNGTEIPMIRPKWIEFISRSPVSDRVMYYAAIPDLDAIQSGAMQTKRFSKSWKQSDPSAQMALLHSRPLPVPRRPGATVSMKVISGAD